MQQSYIPALAEFALTIGLILCIVLCFRAAVCWLPILPAIEDSKHDRGMQQD
jgi:Ni/Fe-hydrogenase subunit HybB-like protein